MRKRIIEDTDGPRGIGLAIVLAALVAAWLVYGVVMLWQIEDKQHAIDEQLQTERQAVRAQELSGTDLDAAMFCIDNHLSVIRTHEGILCSSE